MTGSPHKGRERSPEERVVLVPFGRLGGWIERYDARHGGTEWVVEPDQVGASSPDGAHASFTVPFGKLTRPDLASLKAHLGRPWQLGVVLVRRGGFAVAHVKGPDVVTAKVGQRHVQGKTKAGGWSQQRFARRRDNQAREAFEAAAGHGARILAPVSGGLDLLVLGGDRAAVSAVLDDPGLAAVVATPQYWVSGVGDPRRAVLDSAVDRVRSLEIRIVDPLPPKWSQ